MIFFMDGYHGEKWGKEILPLAKEFIIFMISGAWGMIEAEQGNRNKGKLFMWNELFFHLIETEKIRIKL